MYFKYINEYDLHEFEKEKLISKYLSPTVTSNALTCRIRAAKLLTGSSIGVDSIRKELDRIYNNIVNKIQSNIDDEEDDSEIQVPRNKKISKLSHSILEFSSSIYIVNPKDQICTIFLTRKNCASDDITVK